MDRSLLPTVFAGCLAFAICELTGIDLQIQDHFYHFQTQSWLVDEKAPLLRVLFYTGPKVFIWMIGLSTIAAAVFHESLPHPRFARRDLIVLAATLATAPALVAFGKSTTNTFTPAQIIRYGGNMPYVKIMQHEPPGLHTQVRGRGFPAGHASGGFALFALAGLATTRRGRALGITVGLASGTAMGAYQMLKGAHFLSHTLVTAFLCWVVFLAWRRILPTETSVIGVSDLKLRI